MSDSEAYLGAIILNHGLWEVLHRLAFKQNLSKELCQPLGPLTCTRLFSQLRRSRSDQVSHTIMLYKPGVDAPVGQRIPVTQSSMNGLDENATWVSELG